MTPERERAVRMEAAAAYQETGRDFFVGVLELLSELARVRGLLQRQPHQQVLVGGLGFSVDETIAPLVRLINNGTIQTISSCQGNPGIIGEGGSYGHVSLRSKDLLPLASGLSELLRDYRDDEVMIEVHFTSQPYITVSFRYEAISIVENAFRLQQNSETTVSPGSQQIERTGASLTTAVKSVAYSSQNPNFPQSSSLVPSGAESADIGKLDTADESVACMWCGYSDGHNRACPKIIKASAGSAETGGEK